MPSINLLDVNPDIVCNLIARSKEFHAKEEVVFPEARAESEYEYDWAQILADHQDDLTYQEIDNVITALTYEQQIDLLALLYLGRGDFEDWAACQQAAINNLPGKLTDYLLAHPYLSDFLGKALESFNYTCEESWTK